MKPVPAVLLGTAVGLAALVVPAGVAGAESPSLQGWWTSASLGGTSPAPDVPAKGLLVEGGVGSSSGAGDTGPTAYAALAYDVPSGQTPGNLTLDVAPNSATTPNVTLELCPLDKGTFTPQQGGAISDGPTYKCAQHVTAAPSSSGSSYQFDVSSLVSDGSLAVAVLPTTPTDRVVLNQPGDQSLDLPGGSTSSDTTTTATTTGGSTGSAGSSSGSGTTDSAASTSSSGSSSSGVGVATSPSPGDPSTSPPASSGAAPDLSSTSAAGSPATPPGGTSTGSATSAAPAPSASNQSPAAAASNPSTGSEASEQLAAASDGSGGANPAAVGAVIGAVVIGGLLWTAAGRAASRRVEEEDGPPS